MELILRWDVCISGFRRHEGYIIEMLQVSGRVAEAEGGERLKRTTASQLVSLDSLIICLFINIL